MFETSVVRETAQPAEKRFGLLTASVAFHSIVILAAIVLSVASISFPKNAPNQISAYFREVSIPIPPPLGTPHPAQPTPHPATPPAAAQHQQTAPPPMTPNTIPNDIPTVPAASGPALTGPASDKPGDGPIGDPHGVLGSIGTNPGAPAVADVTDTGPMMPVGDVKPAVVLHRVQPLYPHAAQVMKLNGVVIVECVIGRDGTIRDPHIVRSSSPIFEQSALDAVRQWTFAPGSYHGRPVDTYFDLTVTFTITR